MLLLKLQDTSGNPGLDRLLQGIVGMFEETFPGRVRGYYLVGSQADGSAVALSDLDVRVVIREKFEGEEELQRFLRVREYLRQISPMEIDCPPLDEDRLYHDENWLHETLSIKHASLFLFGEDIRPQLPDSSLEACLRNTAQALRIFIPRLHRQVSLIIPLRYPDAAGEFYGYETPDASQGSQGLKMLVHVAGFLATWIVGQNARQVVMKKSDWLPKYQSLINDHWTPLLSTLWSQCKVAWSYHLPVDLADRARLRLLCEQFLIFENDTLHRFPIPEGAPPHP